MHLEPHEGADSVTHSTSRLTGTVDRPRKRLADTPLIAGWTLNAALTRAVAVWRDGGLKHLWFKILGETVYRRAELFQCTLAKPQQEATSTVSIEIAELAEDEIGDYLALRPDADPGDIRARWAAGQQCFVARHDGRIIHAAWSATGRAWIEYLAREIQLASDEAYIYEAYTAPAFRGGHVALFRSAYERRLFRDTGYRRTLAVVMPENQSGSRFMEKAGYRRIGVIGYVKLGPWRWEFCRVKPGTIPPGGAPASASVNWDETCLRFANKPHYLNRFLGELKSSTHLQLVDRWGGSPATGRVLKTDLFEEALGPDGFLAALADKGRVTIGMDMSPGLTMRARTRGGSALRCLVADTRRLPFSDDSFTLIVSPSTLDHFSDHADLSVSLRELARILEPGGRLIITLDNRQNIFDPLLRVAHRFNWVPYYLGRSYRVSELREELNAAGFVVEATTAILHNPRLMAVAAVALATKVNWPPLERFVERTLLAAQGLEHTAFCYFSGSFVAAKAVKPMRRETG